MSASERSAATLGQRHPEAKAILGTRRQPRRAFSLARSLSQVHRWLGVAMCLFFAMWFASGAVMLFVPFPSLGAADRYRAMLPIDVARVTLSPADAAARALPGQGPLQALGLVEGPTGPLYLLRQAHGAIQAVSANDGQPQPLVTASQAARNAERYRHAASRAIQGPYDDDQWIVHQNFNPYRPFYRVDLDDAAATRVYVSARTGEILQATTHRQRLANYLGSIVHWIYPTVLRRYPTAWSYTVWAISLVGITTASAGLCLGALRSLSSLRLARRSRISPFKGLFKLHHLLGLGGGLFLLTWVFSGWLSVDHGLIFPSGAPTGAQVQAFQGESFQQAARQVSIPALIAAARGQAALDVHAINGTALLTTHRAGTGAETSWRPDGQILHGGVPFDTLRQAVRRAWPSGKPIAEVISRNDPYAHLIYDGLPPEAVRFRLNDAQSTWVHVNDATGQIIDVEDWRRRLYRWLFNGLHTFDIPGLTDHDTLRKAIMLPLLLAGFFLSCTGILLGAKRIRRSFRYTP